MKVYKYAGCTETCNIPGVLFHKSCGIIDITFRHYTEYGYHFLSFSGRYGSRSRLKERSHNFWNVQ